MCGLSFRANVSDLHCKHYTRWSHIPLLCLCIYPLYEMCCVHKVALPWMTQTVRFPAPAPVSCHLHVSKWSSYHGSQVATLRVMASPLTRPQILAHALDIYHNPDKPERLWLDRSGGVISGSSTAIALPPRQSNITDHGKESCTIEGYFRFEGESSSDLLFCWHKVSAELWYEEGSRETKHSHKQATRDHMGSADEEDDHCGQ